MSFATGTAADMDALINTHLKTFMTGDGWTLNDDSWPDHLHLSKGQCFASFRQQLQTFNDGNGVSRTDGELRMHLGSAYNSSPGSGDARYIGQTDSVCSGLTNTQLPRANDLNNSSMQYWIFSGGVSDPDYVYMVVETRGGHYSHIWVGNLDKLGGTYSPGGAFLAGTFYNWWPSLADNVVSDAAANFSATQHHLPMFSTSSSSNQYPITIYTGVANTGGNVVDTMLHRSGQGTNSRYVYALSDRSQATTLDGLIRGGHWASQFLAAGPSGVNGYAPFLPIPIIGNVDGANQNIQGQFLGQLPNIRMVNIKNLDPETDISITPDTWVVFPVRSKNNNFRFSDAPEEFPVSPNIKNISGNMGYAYKKVV